MSTQPATPASDTDGERLPPGLRPLAWSGVLPFAAAPLVAWVLPEWRGGAIAVFIAYGAAILSFLGGARWGRGLAAHARLPRFAEAVLPALVAWLALLLVHHAQVAVAVLAAAFALWAALDARDPLWPRAYRRLRVAISAVVLALHAAWWAL